MKSHRWIEEDKVWIRSHYKRTDCVRMALHFEIAPKTMRTQLWRMGLQRFKKRTGQPCPPPSMDLMHRDEYKPAPWECPREGAMDAFLLPSVHGTAAHYLDSRHP